MCRAAPPHTPNVTSAKYAFHAFSRRWLLLGIGTSTMQQKVVQQSKSWKGLDWPGREMRTPTLPEGKWVSGWEASKRKRETKRKRTPLRRQGRSQHRGTPRPGSARPPARTMVGGREVRATGLVSRRRACYRGLIVIFAHCAST